MEETLENIIHHCKNNNRKAQEKLYKLLSAKVYALCLRYVAVEDAKDALHDAFYTAFTKINQYKNIGSFEGWLKQIAVNICLQKLQKQHFFIEGDIIEEAEEITIHTTENFTQEQVLSLLQEMPLRYKTVFNLFLIEKFSHQEIAKMLQISEGTSKSNLFKAKKWMQQKLVENQNMRKKYEK